eukprot:766841-Hanusia_phi.AAC.2
MEETGRRERREGNESGRERNMGRSLERESYERRAGFWVHAKLLNKDRRVKYSGTWMVRTVGFTSRVLGLEAEA